WGRWAVALIEAGKDEEALAVVDRASAALPGEANAFPALRAFVLIRRGEELVRAGRWGDAVALLGPGLKQLDGAARAEFRAWGVGLFLRRPQAEFRAGRFEQAADAVAGGLKHQPGDARLGEYLGYVVQEWAADLDARDGAARAEALVADMLRRHPDVD